MKKVLIDEKNLISTSIEALDLSIRQRSRALASLAKADTLVGAFFTVLKLLNRDQKRVVLRPSLKSQ
jgi:hypothetical protein